MAVVIPFRRPSSSIAADTVGAKKPEEDEEMAAFLRLLELVSKSVNVRAPRALDPGPSGFDWRELEP